jgi:magnesium-protoporphyrin IX monomethyl ester (oxidative) cyclase
VFPVRFDRFSPYYDEAEAYRLDLHPLDWYAFVYPLPPESLARLAYYFADHHYSAAYALNTASMVGQLRERVNRWISDWWSPETRARLTLEPLPGGGAEVTDSRSGQLLRYGVSEEGRLLLEALSTPKKLVALQKELPGMNVEAGLAELHAHQLLFQENERVLSLVVPAVRPVSIPIPSLRLASAGV